MATEKIEQRVLETAKAEAEALAAEAKRKAEEQLEAAKAENEQRAAGAAEETRERLQQEHDQQTTSARAANKLRLLAHKSRILNDVFEAAVEQFIGDRGGNYEKWLAAQLDSVAGESGSIVPAEADRAGIEKLMTKHGGDGLTLADEPLPLRGGFMLQGEQIDIDLSLDAQLMDMKNGLLPELARRVFEGTENKPE